MSLVKIQGNASGTGEFTIAAPNSNTNRTLTLPDNTGTIITTGSSAVITQSMLGTGVVGNGPTFSAYAGGSDQTISSATPTKIQYNTEFWDTANCYDSSTNYRFTPNVGGYYQVSARWNAAAATASAGELFLYLYKNGSSYKRITNDSLNSNTVGLAVQGSCMVNLNGTSDYIEIYVYQSSGGNLTSNYFAGEGSYFDACLVRAL
jgi:hypothetical protein